MRWGEIPREGDQPERRQAEIERRAAERRIRMAEDVERSAGRWVDRGIQDVPVRDLPHPEDIRGPQDFQKAPYQEVATGFDRLHAMKPYIDGGQGANSDYWREVDRRYGVDYPDGYQKVYESFYGDDAVRLDKSVAT